MKVFATCSKKILVGIEVTLVEPDASRTNFAGGGAVAAEPLAAYDDTAAGEFRRMVASAGDAMFRGDPVKVAGAIIASVEQSPAPKRVTLGPDAYREIHAALTSRISTLEPALPSSGQSQCSGALFSLSAC